MAGREGIAAVIKSVTIRNVKEREGGKIQVPFYDPRFDSQEGQLD